jgi:hypothetical protein
VSKAGGGSSSGNFAITNGQTTNVNACLGVTGDGHTQCRSEPNSHSHSDSYSHRDFNCNTNRDGNSNGGCNR